MEHNIWMLSFRDEWLSVTSPSRDGMSIVETVIVLGKALVLLFYYANAVLETIRFRTEKPKATIGNDAFLFEGSHCLSSSAQIVKSRPEKNFHLSLHVPS